MKIFIDTETTGLPRRRNAPYSEVSNWPRLVQLAWVIVDDNGKELPAVISLSSTQLGTQFETAK